MVDSGDGCRRPRRAGYRGLDRAWRAALWLAYRGQLVYWFVVRPVEPSAHVALWCGGRILLVKASYRRHLSMPAGGVKRGETPRAAAVRELREEVDIEAKPDSLREAGVLVSREQWKEDRAHVFELALDAAPGLRVDGREIVAARLMRPEHALRLHISTVLRRYLANALRASA